MINKLDAYMNGILQWNEHINLTAIREPEDFIRKHYLDSLFPAFCCRSIRRPA